MVIQWIGGLKPRTGEERLQIISAADLMKADPKTLHGPDGYSAYEWEELAKQLGNGHTWQAKFPVSIRCPHCGALYRDKPTIIKTEHAEWFDGAKYGRDKPSESQWWAWWQHDGYCQYPNWVLVTEAQVRFWNVSCGPWKERR